jgi:hypothetical protein
MIRDQQLRHRLSVLLFAAGVGVSILFVAFVALRLWKFDFRTPLSYSQDDTIIMLLYIKGLIQDGWPNTISHLSAPFVYPGAAFPMLTSTDWMLIKALSIFTSEPGILLNVFWLLTLVFSGWAACYAGIQLGMSRTLAAVSGILYAFLPFALLRSAHHLNLVYYLVPLLGLLAVVIASRGEGVRNAGQATVVGLLACIAQGFNYVYFSFFAVLLFAIAALIGYRQNGMRFLKLPAAAITLVTLCTALNLAPALKSWDAQGKPPEMGYKSVAEAETYGAKLRLMLSPHRENPVPPLGHVAQKAANAGFPLENENTTARLGLFGAFGLLLIILSVLRREGHLESREPARAVSGLGMATLLLITVGGFGAIINVLTVADIRAYNRFSVYLSFFAISAAALWLQKKLDGAGRPKRALLIAVAIALAGLSLHDQLLDAKPLRANQQEDTVRMTAERAAVNKLERALPIGAMVLELPFTGYPPIYHFHQMHSYDHGRPFIWSSTLKWSWPSFTRRHRDWQERMSKLQGAELVEAAALSGFSAIWIDRAAYQDGGRKLIEDLSSDKVEPLDIGSERYSALDIGRAVAELQARIGAAEFSRRSTALLGSPILAEWKRGFFDVERNPESRYFRWAQKEAVIELRNTSDALLEACLSFYIGSPSEGTVRVEGAGQPREFRVTSIPQQVRLPLALGASEKARIRLSGDMAQVSAPGDPRKLFFYVMDYDVASHGAMENREGFCSK